jgi:hypothetical protein
MMMLSERIERLRQEYTDQYVVVDGSRPELARFKDVVGQVKTINCNGRALVEFDGNSNRGWYDIELDYLKVVDEPERKPDVSQGKAAAGKPGVKRPDATAKGERKERLSPLELARLEKEAGHAGREAPSNEARPPVPAEEKGEQHSTETSRKPGVEEHSG